MDLFEECGSCPVEDSCLRVLVVGLHNRLLAAEDGVRLSCAGLSVRQEGCVVAFEEFVNEMLGLLVDDALWFVLVDVVEVVDAIFE